MSINRRGALIKGRKGDKYKWRSVQNKNTDMP